MEEGWPIQNRICTTAESKTFEQRAQQGLVHGVLFAVPFRRRGTLECFKHWKRALATSVAQSLPMSGRQLVVLIEEEDVSTPAYDITFVFRGFSRSFPVSYTHLTLPTILLV